MPGVFRTLGVGLLIFCCIASRAATFTVANGDLAGFRAAIQAANATVAADTIVLANNGDYSFTSYYPTANPLNRTALPIIMTAITIEGNGSVIRRSNASFPPVSKFRLLRVSATGALVLRNSTVQNGDLGSVNGTYSDANGSGLRNDEGSLAIEHCRFEDQHSVHWAAGVYTTGPTIISDTKFIENSSSDGGTGAIEADGCSTLIIERCHFSENRGDDTIHVANVPEATISRSSIVKALDAGAGVASGLYVYNSTLAAANCTVTGGTQAGIHMVDSDVTVTHCTITDHGSNPGWPGKGIYADGTSLRLRNSIVALNDNGPGGSNPVDCTVDFGSVLLENIRNLIGDGSCNPDFTGHPDLGSLGYHGGNTMVFPLIEGTQAIDNGHDSYSEPTDQRGVARPIGAHCDIGAYEGSIPDERRWRRIIVDLIHVSEPYIIICDPLPDEGPVVAIAGTRTVPARSINAASLTLGNARPGSARVHGFSDVNRDGIEDLTVSFRWVDVNAGAFRCEDVTLLEMQGWTSTGQPIVGYMDVVAR